MKMVSFSVHRQKVRVISVWPDKVYITVDINGAENSCYLNFYHNKDISFELNIDKEKAQKILEEAYNWEPVKIKINSCSCDNCNGNNINYSDPVKVKINDF